MQSITSTNRSRLLISLACSAIVFLVLLSIPRASSESRGLGITPKPTISPTSTPVIVEVLPEVDPSIGPEPNLSVDAVLGGRDIDCDGVPSNEDNCPFVYNPDQKDKDKNGIGDACDGLNKGRQEFHCDSDSDGILDYRDNCPLVCNPDQEDKNKNGIGDVCDPELLSSWVHINPCSKRKKRCSESKKSTHR